MTKNKNERCPYCLGTNLRPKGWNTKKTKRRLKCGCCKKQFVMNGKSWFVSDVQEELIDALLLERISLRGICRVVKISLSWLLCYIKKLYSEQPDDLNYDMPKSFDVKALLHILRKLYLNLFIYYKIPKFVFKK